VDYFYAVLNQIVIFMIIIVIGFAAVKTKFISASVLQPLSIVFTKIIIPVLVFVNAVSGATREDMLTLGFFVGVIACVYIALIIIMTSTKKILRLSGNRGRLFPLTFTFGNVGFLGIPLLLSVFGQRIMVLITMYAIVDMLVLWTYGYTHSFPHDKKLEYTPKALINLINPPIIAILLSIILIMFEIRIPMVIDRSLWSIANAGMALPFIYIGGMLATVVNLRSLFKYEYFVGIFIKMILFPIAVFAVLQAFGLDHNMSIGISILSGLPTMPLIAMLAATNGSDGEYATGTVMVTTIASLFTLTLVTYLITVVL